jgi:hypothetical protein
VRAGVSIAVLLAVLLATAMAGCTSDDAGGGGEPDAGPPGDAMAAMPRVELGTGGASYREIATTGATLELVHGPQGGFHVDVAVRFWDVEPDGTILGYVGRDTATDTVITLPSRFELSARRVVREGDHWVRAGDILVFDAMSPDAVVGKTVEITATLEPTAGAPVTDTRTIVVVDDGM